MTRSFGRLMAFAGAAAASAFFSLGCESWNEPSEEITGSGGTRWIGPGYTEPAPPPPPAPTPAPLPAPRGDCSPVVGPDQTVASLAFPTGDVRSSALMLHQVLPRQVRRNVEYTKVYQVCNLTSADLQNVVVYEESLDNMRIVRSTPNSQQGPEGIFWNLGTLGPRETRTIEVVVTSSAVGTATNCISASYNNVLCNTTEVVEPALALTKTVSETAALVCDPVQLCYTVTNDGSGPATGVVITDTLANGLTSGGTSAISIPVGTLAPGQSVQRCIDVDPTGPGRYFSPASAAADGGLTANAGEVGTVYTQPELRITCDSRASQFIGRNSTFEFTVTNVGNGPARDANVTISGSGGSFVRASSGGTATGTGANFALGTLEPNQSRTVSVTYVSSAAGTVSASANASAYCADAASTRCTTEYEGIPAILLEMVDNPDPVEVGTQTTYTVTVTNQGSAPDTNIRVEMTLPAELSFVSGGGATAVSSRGQAITFAPVASLAPGARVTWTVDVRATAAGNVRTAVQMTSDQFVEPVNETEATNLYE
ncbi:MAG: CARDB domain-containing protein [Planctomycetota bacterium]